MSDFLDQFTNKNYRKSETEDPAVPETEAAVLPESQSEPADVPETESSSDPGSNGSAGSAGFTGLKSTEHEVVIDTTYNKHKTIRIVSICATILLLCAGGFFAYLHLSKIPMMEFTGRAVSEARTWALKSGIFLEEQLRYDLLTESGTVLAQSVKSGERIARNSAVILEISKGPDPSEKIGVPDFSSMTVPEIQEWIDDNRLLNTQFQEENSSTIEKGKYIRAEYRDISVDAEHFTRSDHLLIYVSIGTEGITQNVLVPDLSGMIKTAVDSWAQNYGVTILYDLELSDTVAQDVVISQEKAPGVTIPSGSTMQITVSAGPGILIPDYSAILKEDAPSAETGLEVMVKTVYDFSVPYGRLISQSVPAGSRVFVTENKVTLTYSDGKPYIDDLRGSSEKDLAAYFYGFKLKGIVIPYSISYIDSDAPKGSVVSVSRFNEFLDSRETIIVKISRGNLPPPEAG